MSDVPENANENCPGTESQAAGKSGACTGCPNQSYCASGARPPIDPDIERICERLRHVKHKVANGTHDGNSVLILFDDRFSFSVGKAVSERAQSPRIWRWHLPPSATRSLHMNRSKWACSTSTFVGRHKRECLA